MEALTISDVYKLMIMHIEKKETTTALFGEGFSNAAAVAEPFMQGDRFPESYLEFPLKGEASVDITILYNNVSQPFKIDSPLAAGTEKMIETYRSMKSEIKNICCGFEIDTSKECPGPAAVHFETFEHTDLVIPFCESIGQGAYGNLYLEFAKRMENVCPPAFFGIFRGRSDAPLRVCGYISEDVRTLCTGDENKLAKVLDTAHFTAYDDVMLKQIQRCLAIAPAGVDYQMDIFPDGTMGDMFSLDIALPEKSAQSMRSSFENGYASHVIKQLIDWDIADKRSFLIQDLASSFAIPDKNTDGDITVRAILIKPAWMKIRWKNKRLQTSKCYCLLRSYI